MKKTIKQILLTTLSVTLLFVACQKNGQNIINNSPGNTTLEPMQVIGYGGPNYCKGCGQSTSDQYFCKSGSCSYGGPDGECPAIIINNLSNSNTNSINLQEAYSTRDNFLIKTEKGQWYITYYYELGFLAANEHLITINNVGDYISFGIMTQHIATVVANGTISEIPISIEYKNKAITLINEYRRHTNNQILLGYMDVIESDLNKFVGKQVGYIRNEIGL